MYHTHNNIYICLTLLLKSKEGTLYNSNCIRLVEEKEGGRIQHNGVGQRVQETIIQQEIYYILYCHI